MPDDRVQGAIDFLVEEVTKLLLEVAEKKRAVNTLCNTIGISPTYGDVETSQAEGPRVFRPDQFYGKPFSTAAQEFLATKKMACSAEEVTNGLERGGFDFPWKGEHKIRNVAISLAKNTYMFAKLPNNTFGLLEWYPEVKKKREEIQRKSIKSGNATLGILESMAPEKESTTEPEGDIDIDAG